MKLVWSPETASKAYIDTVKSVRTLNPRNIFQLSKTIDPNVTFPSFACSVRISKNIPA
jgi:hypothetical protein